MWLSVCSGSTRPQEWELQTIGVLNGLLGAMSETVTLDPKNISFMDSDGRIFANPSVAHPTIIMFISRRQYKAIELYEDGFRDLDTFSSATRCQMVWIPEAGSNPEQLLDLSTVLESNEIG